MVFRFEEDEDSDQEFDTDKAYDEHVEELCSPPEESETNEHLSGEELPAPPANKRAKKEKGSDGPQGSCAVWWKFTWNNYPDDAIQILHEYDTLLAGWACGKEVAPTTGTPHLQGFLQFRSKDRPSKLTKLWDAKVWFEAATKRWRTVKKDLMAYCAKEGDTYGAGSLKPPEKVKVIEVLRPWQKTLLDMVLCPPDDRSIFWIWETAGGVGKSALTKLLVVKHKAIICAGKAADMKYQIAQMEDKPTIVIFDVPRTSLDYVSYTGLEEIKNGCFASNKYESGMVTMNCPHLVIFANAPPNLLNVSLDRWKLFMVEKMNEEFVLVPKDTAACLIQNQRDADDKALKVKKPFSIFK